MAIIPKPRAEKRERRHLRVRKQLAGVFGSPAVPSAGSGRAVRRVLVSCHRGFRRVLG